MSTDFEAQGLARGPVRFAGRHSVVTVDFEAFSALDADRWCEAMRHWSRAAQARDLRTTFFLAVEYAVRLRFADGEKHRRLLEAAAELASAGAEFHPHSHGVVDLQTGERPRGSVPAPVAGYRRRPSVYHDVVYRNGADWEEWLGSLLREYEIVLGEGGIPRPAKLAFRAGGWDHGSSAEDMADYVRGLARGGVDFDSSATAGAFGTRSWRVGDHYGDNAFRLADTLVEVAPCWSVAAKRRALSPGGLAALARLGPQWRLWSSRRASGAFVTVLHFNELLDDGAPLDRVKRRIDRLLDVLRAVDRAFDLRSDGFGQLEPTPS